jgi:hypothetical protein
MFQAPGFQNILTGRLQELLAGYDSHDFEEKREVELLSGTFSYRDADGTPRLFSINLRYSQSLHGVGIAPTHSQLNGFPMTIHLNGVTYDEEVSNLMQINRSGFYNPTGSAVYSHYNDADTFKRRLLNTDGNQFATHCEFYGTAPSMENLVLGVKKACMMFQDRFWDGRRFRRLAGRRKDNSYADWFYDGDDNDDWRGWISDVSAADPVFAPVRLLSANTFGPA